MKIDEYKKQKENLARARLFQKICLDGHNGGQEYKTQTNQYSAFYLKNTDSRNSNIVMTDAMCKAFQRVLIENKDSLIGLTIQKMQSDLIDIASEAVAESEELIQDIQEMRKFL